MDIVTLKFAGFGILSMLIFYLLKGNLKKIFLLLLSCYFITSFSFSLLLYVVVYSIINYFIGIRLSKSTSKSIIYRVGLVINLSQLIILKYSTFALDPVFNAFGSDIVVSKLSQVIVPIGISYFTLQGIGYITNIKMGWEKAESNLLDFLLYLMYFPKFLSGPVERSNHFLPQIKIDRVFDRQQVTLGLRIALLGFFKKIAIANQLAPFVNSTYMNFDSVDGASLIVLFIIQPLYLYFDFSGYTDIAIGISKTFGIELLPNFNRPFFAENVSTFWKRFHISLSSWFNDYVFRQVSFRRRSWGILASTYAVFLTFTLFGIWHGAGWNFMLLGFLQAVAINFEFFTKKWRLRMFSVLPMFFRTWLGRVFTYLFYCISLIFFFSGDLDAAFSFLLKLFTINKSIAAVILNSIPLQTIAFMLILLIWEWINNDFIKLANKINLLWLEGKARYVILRWVVYGYALIIMFVLGNDVQQFIYFKF